MFEVGKAYRFRIIRDGAEEEFVGTVEAYEHPLLKLADNVAEALTIQLNYFGDEQQSSNLLAIPEQITKGQIINVGSLNFVSARVLDDPAQAGE